MQTEAGLFRMPEETGENLLGARLRVFDTPSSRLTIRQDLAMRQKDPSRLSAFRFRTDFGEMLKDNSGIRQTIELLAKGKSHRIIAIDVIPHFQAGAHGIISIIRAQIQIETSVPTEVTFVMHLSRYSVDDNRSRYLVTEYATLRLLRERFEDHLSERTRRQVSVTKPYVYGATGKVLGQMYPYFTMRYIPQGELHLSAVSLPEFSPYFNYAVANSPSMQAENDRALYAALNGNGHATELITSMLIGNWLLYLLSGKQAIVPTINAGAWVGSIVGRKPICLTSATAAEACSPVEYMDLLRAHVEEVETNRGLIPVRPFAQITEDQMAAAMEKAASLIVKKK